MSTSNDGILAELEAWSESTGTSLCGGSLTTILNALDAAMGIHTPADLTTTDVAELLLDVLPHYFDIAEDSHACIVRTLRSVIGFLDDTGKISAGETVALERAVDKHAPAFSDAMADPSKWGPMKAAADLMRASGVDPTDEDAAAEWAARLGAPELSQDDIPDEEVPGLRLPDRGEIADMARASASLALCVQIALWIGGSPKLEPGRYQLDAMAKELGIASDVPYLLSLAEAAGMLQMAGEESLEISPTPEAFAWPELDGERVLAIWRKAFEYTYAHSIGQDQQISKRGELMLAHAGISIAVYLFHARGRGLGMSLLRENTKHEATAVLPEVRRERNWQSWVRDHGDPTDRIADRLVQLGAAVIDDDHIRFTPPALNTMLDTTTIEVEILPPAESMTAAQLALARHGMTGPEHEAEVIEWLRYRSRGQAIQELLDAAACGSPRVRSCAFDIAESIGGDHLDLFEKALERPQLRAYATDVLANAGVDIETTLDDAAYLMIDDLAQVDPGASPGILLEKWNGSIDDPGEARLMLDAIGNAAHPAAGDVLNRLAVELPSNDLAAAARAAAERHNS